MSKHYLLTGQILRFAGDPFSDAINDAVRIDSGSILIRDGVIDAIGATDDLIAQAPDAQRFDYSDALICPGFVDAHAHYPQTAIIASWGKRLIDWLNRYTFPEEMRFGDPEYAAITADRYLDLLLDLSLIHI